MISELFEMLHRSVWVCLKMQIKNILNNMDNVLVASRFTVELYVKIS